MKPIRTTLFAILFIYLALIVSLSFNAARTASWVSAHPAVLPYFSLTGMGVFLAIFLLYVFERKRHDRALQKKEAEKNEIKARVYEMQRRNDETERTLHAFENSLPESNSTKPYDKTEDNL